MHILIIPSWYPAYPEDISGSFFREQAIALSEQGCKVGVVYPQLRSLREWKKIFSGRYGVEKNSDQALTILRYHGVNWYGRNKKLYIKSWQEKGVKLFNEYVKINGVPDVIHAHSILNGGILAKYIYEKFKIPFILTEHSSTFARNLLSQYDLEISKSVVERSKVLLAVSEKFCKLLNQILPTEVGWYYLPNIVNKNFASKAIRKKKEDKFIFVNVGSLDDNKNQIDILKAFSQEFGSMDRITLKLIGTGPELKKLKDFSKKIGIDKQINFTGELTRERVIEEMVTSNAFVVSSRYETFGVVIIEALALGLPVVATCCGGPESIVRKEDGLLVPVGDVKNLGNAMRFVYENSEKYDANEIKESCYQRFSEQAITTKLIEIYHKVLNSVKYNGA